MHRANATARIGSAPSANGSIRPLHARNTHIDAISATRATSMTQRAIRWLSSSDRRDSRSVCLDSHMPGRDASTRLRHAMTPARPSAFSSSRS